MLPLEEELDLAEALLAQVLDIVEKSKDITSEGYGINSCARMFRMVLIDFLKKNGRNV